MGPPAIELGVGASDRGTAVDKKGAPRWDALLPTAVSESLTPTAVS